MTPLALSSSALPSQKMSSASPELSVTHQRHSYRCEPRGNTQPTRSSSLREDKNGGKRKAVEWTSLKHFNTLNNASLHPVATRHKQLNKHTLSSLTVCMEISPPDWRKHLKKNTSVGLDWPNAAPRECVFDCTYYPGSEYKWSVWSSWVRQS